MLFAAGVPNVPYTLGSGVFVPFTQAHSFVCPLAGRHRNPNISTAKDIPTKDLLPRVFRKAFVILSNNPQTFGENNSWRRFTGSSFQVPARPGASMQGFPDEICTDSTSFKIDIGDKWRRRTQLHSSQKT
jgi:hypothetical protein